MDVQHLGAAHALVDPAHHVAQDALGVVLDFLALLVGAPLGVAGHGYGQQSGEQVIAQGGGIDFFQFLLHCGHVDLVVVQRVQRGTGGAGHPGGVGTGLGVVDLLLQHFGHQVGHGPHALADLRLAAQAAGQAHQHVVLLVGLDPGAALHVALADHGAGLHGGVHFVAGAIEETGIDEGHAAAGGVDAGLQVDAGAALLVHDAQLHGAVGQAQQLLHAAEQLVGKGDFGRAMHFRLHDVDAALARVAQAVLAQTLEVVHGNGGGDHGVHDAFGDFLAFGAPQDGGVGHQVADVAHEQHGAAMQAQLVLAVGGRVDAVRVQAARQLLAALFERFGQRTAQNAQPVAVALQLVFGIDGGHGVFQVHDGGHGRFHHHVAHAGQIGLADGGAAVNADIDVQAVVLQQDAGRAAGIALVAGELGRILQAGHLATLDRHLQLAVLDKIGRGVGMRMAGQRHRLIEEVAGEGNDLLATLGVVALATLGAIGVGDGIGAVQGIVQAAPARVGGVERVAAIHDRHHQLRAGLHGQFVIDIRGGDLHVGGLRHQIADLLQELAVGCHVADRAGVGLVPGVEFGLETVTLGQQGGIARGQVVHQLVKALPEGFGRDAQIGQHLAGDEIVQRGRDLQLMGLGTWRGHEDSFPTMRSMQKTGCCRAAAYGCYCITTSARDSSPKNPQIDAFRECNVVLPRDFPYSECIATVHGMRGSWACNIRQPADECVMRQASGAAVAAGPTGLATPVLPFIRAPHRTTYHVSCYPTQGHPAGPPDRGTLRGCPPSHCPSGFPHGHFRPVSAQG